jgi:hypothetical protein
MHKIGSGRMIGTLTQEDIMATLNKFIQRSVPRPEKIRMTTEYYEALKKSIPPTTPPIEYQTLYGIPFEIDDTVGGYEIVFKDPEGINIIVNQFIPSGTVFFLKGMIAGSNRNQIFKAMQDNPEMVRDCVVISDGKCTQ